jgi:cellulose biosynthesis protein BcsQ
LSLAALTRERLHGPEVVKELRKRFPNEVFRTVIRENVRLAEAPSFGQAITDYATESAGADDYRALAGEVLKRLATEGLIQWHARAR